MSERIVLAWTAANVGQRLAACRYGCGGKTILRDADGKPAHKVCAEQALQRRAARAAAASGRRTSS